MPQEETDKSSMRNETKGAGSVVNSSTLRCRYEEAAGMGKLVENRKERQVEFIFPHHLRHHPPHSQKFPC